ncbi:DUF1330 domain-containing protein [Micromonospora sp. NPDC047707]|uniref:DUF1330 domain-containing protein n=1 Tax=Micromonospora sp. NPDC047707 TaxID=3154498 RepID=UPI003455C108
MKAYFFCDMKKVLNEQAIQEYRASVLATVEKHGGRYMVVGGEVRSVEGSRTFAFPVLIEFPSMQDALRWYHSPEYRPLRELRLKATEGDAVFFSGPSQIPSSWD